MAATGGSGRVRVYLDDSRMSAEEAVGVAADLVEAALHAGIDSIEESIRQRLLAALSER